MITVSDTVHCTDFPCTDVQHQAYHVPEINLDPQHIQLVLVSEAVPASAQEDYDAPGDPLCLQTSLLAFNDAGVPARSLADLLERGIYLTHAVKCAKTGYGIQTDTVKACSHLLEAELDLFSNTAVYLLMGDVAIKALNAIAKKRGEPRPIPAGSTYKIRGGAFTYQGRRVFPSYLQAGPSFFIEKSKRRMITEDIRSALQLI